MPFSTRLHDRACILAPEGRFLGMLERERWNEAVNEVLEAGCETLIIDCSQTDFMDSVGIGLIAGATRRLRAAGGDVRLAGVHGRVGDVLRMLRLIGNVIESYPDLDAALRARPSVDGVVAS